MGIQKRMRISLLAMMAVFLCCIIVISLVSFAEETEFADLNTSREAEIVFLLDTSESMRTQDRAMSAVDAIRQGAYSLPSNYPVGIVSYGTEVQEVMPLNTDRQKLDVQLEQIKYSGYTNAGAGLSQAISLFSEVSKAGEKERYIIMLSDGEIDMPDEERAHQSREAYLQAVAEAKEKGIKIFIIAVGKDWKTPQVHIFYAAEKTNGAIYWDGQSGSLSQIAGKIVDERISFPRKTLEITDMGDGEAIVRTTFPDGADRISILVLNPEGIEQVTANDRTEEVNETKEQIITGQRFAVAEFVCPQAEPNDQGEQTGQIELHISAPDFSSAQAFLCTEYAVTPQVAVEYRIEPVFEIAQTEKEKQTNKAELSPSFQHFADITITFTDTKDQQTVLFSEPSFSGKEINFSLNKEEYTAVLKDGKIRQTIPADDIEQIEVFVDLHNLDAICHIHQPGNTQIPKVPDPEIPETVPEPDYRPLWIVLGILAGLIIFLGFWYLKKNRTTVIYMAQPKAPGELPQKLPSRKLSSQTTGAYTGKLNLYLLQNVDGQDVPPQTYRLFGRQGGPLTLAQILSSCEVKLGKVGEEGIVFYPGPDHSVIVTDQSEHCTVLKKMEILKKGTGYPVYYNEKITITFEDGITEMEVHYKNLKPSEKQAYG